MLPALEPAREHLQRCCADVTTARRALQWSGLKRSLPDNVHLLTLEQWEAGTILLRLEHFYAKDDHMLQSQPATVQLKVCVSHILLLLVNN